MRIKFVGDIMLGELLENFRRGVRSSVERGIDPFAFCRQELKDSDLTVANLECVVSDYSDKEGFLRNILRAPREFAEVLKSSGIGAVNLANNHALDHGRQALKETFEVLEANGIHTFGCEESNGESRRLVLDHDGLTVGVLGFNLANFAPERLRLKAEGICADLQKSKREVDFLILSLHWGEEYADCPTTAICDLGRRFFACGCDLIHGHHSHRLQGIALWEGKLFAPSLGNFIFDDRRRENRLTAVLDVNVRGKGLHDFSAKPFYINRRFQPMPRNDLAPKLESLNGKLQRALNPSDRNEGTILDRGVKRMVARGHLKNKIRMRLLMLLNFPQYMAHLRTLWRYRRRSQGTQFSITDSMGG